MPINGWICVTLEGCQAKLFVKVAVFLRLQENLKKTFSKKFFLSEDVTCNITKHEFHRTNYLVFRNFKKFRFPAHFVLQTSENAILDFSVIYINIIYVIYIFYVIIYIMYIIYVIYIMFFVDLCNV